MNIKFNDLSLQWDAIKETALPKIEDVLQSGWYIGGPCIEQFEKSFAAYCNTKYAVGISNGTDALKLCLAAFELDSPEGVDVIMPANTYIADSLAVHYQTNNKYRITLIDCNEYYQMDTDILEDYLKYNRYYPNGDCVIIPVHLYGHPTDMKRVMELAEKYDCRVLEDASQAHGTKCYGKLVGSFGDMAAFSCYPGKNLGAAGDAGIVTTNDEIYYNRLKSLRNYGSSKKYYYDSIGWNCRLDPIQAVILEEKLKLLDEWTKTKNELVNFYNQELANVNQIVLPPVADYVDVHSYHIYLIRTKQRDELQAYLEKNGIPTVIHYPIPIQLSTPFEYLDDDYNHENKNTKTWANEILSLPLHPYMKQDEVKYVTEKIKEFYATQV